jgi:zinc protease
VVVVGLACASLGCGAQHYKPDHPFTLTEDADFRSRVPDELPAGTKHAAELQRFVLANGMTVLVMERHALPLVSVRYVSRWANEQGPLDDAGLTMLTANALRLGGTRLSDGREVQDPSIDDVSVRVDAGRSYTELSFSVGSEAFEVATRVLSRVVRYPTFTELALPRAQTVAPVLDGATALDFVSRRLVSGFLFGWDQPRALRATRWAEQIEGFTAERIVRFHDERYRPDASAVIVVGDVSAAAALQVVQREFGDWPRATNAPAYEPVPAQRLAPVIHVAQGGPPAFVFIAMRTVPYTHQDHWALELLRRILADGLVSRTARALRHDGGLSYMTSASSRSNSRDGVLTVMSAIEPDAIEEALARLTRVLDELETAPVSDEELTKSKRAQLRELRGDGGSNDEIAAQLAELYAFGDPLEVLKTAEDAIAELTPESMQRVAARYFAASQRLRLVIGPYRAHDWRLRNLGEVESVAPY